MEHYRYQPDVELGYPREVACVWRMASCIVRQLAGTKRIDRWSYQHWYRNNATSCIIWEGIQTNRTKTTVQLEMIVSDPAGCDVTKQRYA